jgi:hypothetical protein
MGIIANIDKALNQAAVSTANKMIRKGNTAANKKVREVYNIKTATLNKYTKVYRASKIRPDAQIVIRGRRMPLFGFGARQTRRGVTIRVKRTTGRRTVLHAFIAQMPSGHQGIFIRKTKGRLPIRELYTVSPAKMFEVEGEKAFKEIIDRDVGKTFDHELQFYMGKI